jgi:antitoxin ParD1/3/4
MDQMNVSITDQLAGYVRKKVRSGRYNNASEVVRDALRRMEEEDERALRLAKPSAEDVLADLTAEQLDGLRQRVRASIANIEAGKFTEYEGREGLKKLAEEMKARGRTRLAKQALNR